MEKQIQGASKARYDELPESPEGWVWVTWDQIGFFQNGRSFPSSEYQSSGFKLLRPGNLVSNGKIAWDAENTRYLPISGHKTTLRTLLVHENS